VRPAERCEDLGPDCTVHLFVSIAPDKGIPLTSLYSFSVSGFARMTWQIRFPSFVRGSSGMGVSVELIVGAAVY
jgi:hypothetical protein